MYIFLLKFVTILAYLYLHESKIDSSTEKNDLTIKRLHDNQILYLSMSDEFSTNGRTFGPGEDQLFEALNEPGQKDAKELQFYNSSSRFVTTKNGSLVITITSEKSDFVEFNYTSYTYEKVIYNYTSAMIQSWNKFCFTGGVLEVSLQLPGPFNSGGLWPAFWLMGNLARATVPDSGYFIWPWSYNTCDVKANSQKFNACIADPGYNFNSYQGRGSAEIDLLEVMPGNWNYPSGSNELEFVEVNTLRFQLCLFYFY